jgi:hypothetical protein
VTVRLFSPSRWVPAVFLLFSAALLCCAQGSAPEAVAGVPARFGLVPEKFKNYAVVLEPDKNEPEWWAGAPSVVRDARGTFWMACRMRTADAPLGLRGCEIRILRSEDGIHFRKVHGILREQVPIPGFERPALLIDPKTGRFKLYGCGPWKGGAWSIIKFDDADEPARFVPASARPVIQAAAKSGPRDEVVAGYKDPFIIHADGAWHCFVIGTLRSERLFHFQSNDGERWEPVGHRNQSIMDLSGWHNFFVRPASVVPLGAGYLFVYEGSNAGWHDPVYNIATGLGFTFDLHHVIDLTPDSPLLISTTPSELFHTWRYSHWMAVGEELWVYAEVARPNRTNEIRLFRLRR